VINSSKLIAIDGPDGSGKTELVVHLADKISKSGMSVDIFSGYFLPVSFHDTLMESKGNLVRMDKSMPEDVEQTIYTLEWLAKLKTELSTKLNLNNFVLCDRYLLSRFALASLQGSQTSKNILQSAIDNKNIYKPTLNLLLMANPDISYQRILKRSKARGINVEIKEQPKQLEVIYNSFNEVQKCVPWTINRIDAKQDELAVFENALEYIEI